jgi:glyoxylase-like metal-dependent hydrolase (beta-lactamase superfamily II)
VNWRHTTNARLAVADRHTYLIDLFHQGEPRTIGSYLLLDEKPALVEVGPSNTLEQLLAGVREAGLAPSELRYLFLTHIHLDHAGATGALLAHCPQLEVFVHERGAPHLIAPERLWQSAGRVFGAKLEPLFGEPLPAPQERVHVLADGDEVSLGTRRLQAVYTPGHAAHHFAFWDPERRWMYSGDVAGCNLPDGFYNHPPTPAPEVDLVAWFDSLARLRGYKPERLLFTHFGWTDEAVGELEQLEATLKRRAALVEEGLKAGLSDEEIVGRFASEVDERLAALVGPVLARRYMLLGDAAINAPGLIRYWHKRA